MGKKVCFPANSGIKICIMLSSCIINLFNIENALSYGIEIAWEAHTAINYWWVSNIAVWR
jgi:hypothetical protein